MLTLHVVEGGESGFEDAILSFGILNPHPSSKQVEVYDFGLQTMIEPAAGAIVAVAEGEPARVTFTPDLFVESARVRMAANKAKVLRFPRKTGRVEVPTNFVSGYDTYAREAAMYWRQQGVSSQPVLAAGSFALASVQTSIVRALVLMDLLGPFVLENKLPSYKELWKLIDRSGAGFQATRAKRLKAFEAYRQNIVEEINEGSRDNALRKKLATEVGLPSGLGLAKSSFTLALLGNDCGCLDARIVNWAFTDKVAEKFLNRISSKRKDGAMTDVTYQVYRNAELRILKDTPFFDQRDPVGLARAQWMLWESLGPEQERTHTHEEMFRFVVEEGLELPR